MAGNLFDLSGRVALVTGGNGGIGRAIALAFAEAGASVAILGRNEAKNRAVLQELQGTGVPSLVLQVDITNRELLQPAVEKVEQSLARSSCSSRFEVWPLTLVIGGRERNKAAAVLFRNGGLEADAGRAGPNAH